METLRQQAKAKGRKHYYTGIPCKHGHLSKRRVSDGGCMACRVVRQGEFHKTEKGKAKRNKDAKRAQKKHPDKMRARNSVNSAVRLGSMKRLPCEKCGATSTQAHHPDYKKPRLVVWLCKKHHDEIHE